MWTCTNNVTNESTKWVVAPTGHYGRYSPNVSCRRWYVPSRRGHKVKCHRVGRLWGGLGAGVSHRGRGHRLSPIDITNIRHRPPQSGHQQLTPPMSSAFQHYWIPPKATVIVSQHHWSLPTSSARHFNVTYYGAFSRSAWSGVTSCFRHATFPHSGLPATTHVEYRWSFVRSLRRQSNVITAVHRHQLPYRQPVPPLGHRMGYRSPSLNVTGVSHAHAAGQCRLSRHHEGLPLLDQSRQLAHYRQA